MRAFTLLAAILFFGNAAAIAQQRIDGSFAFETDPAKEYSLYIPSGYVPGEANRLMLGLHPWNVNLWDAASWCDTLIVFAEANGLILACPDGGDDGQVDDPIDVAFTTALLDSVSTWYSVDGQKTYAMGFSWGGRATYTYGLSNVDRFGGYIPIGAAINGTNEVGGLLENATGEPFYIVHGSLDSPNTRFYPVRDSLIARGAHVEWNLLSGVGHTIDFPSRNQILNVAFAWIDSVNCSLAAGVDQGSLHAPLRTFETFPNPIPHGETLTLRMLGIQDGESMFDLFDPSGRRLRQIAMGTGEGSLDTRSLPKGIYLLRPRSIDAGPARKVVVY